MDKTCNTSEPDDDAVLETVEKNLELKCILGFDFWYNIDDWDAGVVNIRRKVTAGRMLSASLCISYEEG